MRAAAAACLCVLMAAIHRAASFTSAVVVKFSALSRAAPLLMAKTELEAMKKADFVAAVAAKSGLTKTQTDAAIAAFMDTVMEAVADGKKISLVGFGTFESRERSARQGRNPQTGEAISIAASTSPAFSPSKAFKDRVKEAQ